MIKAKGGLTGRSSTGVNGLSDMSPMLDRDGLLRQRWGNHTGVNNHFPRPYLFPELALDASTRDQARTCCIMVGEREPAALLS